MEFFQKNSFKVLFTNSIFYKILFNDSTFYKNLFMLALPIIIQNFISSLLNMLSTIMIGKVGEIEIAAVGIANQYFFLFNLIMIGLFSGFGIFISQFWGKKDVQNIKKMVGLGAIIGFSISFLFMILALLIPKEIISIFSTDKAVIADGANYLRIVCVSYIFTAISLNFSFASRSVEQAFIPMIVTSFALICDTFLNYTLIFGHFGAPVMGVKGAALATLIARMIEMTLLVSYIYFNKNILAFRLSDLHGITKEFICKIFKTVSNVVLNDACWGLGFVLYSIAYGRIGAKAMASIQICTTVQNLYMVITFGMCSAAAVMIGNKVGSGDEKQAKDYSNKFLILGSFVGLILGLILALASPTIISFFHVSTSVVNNCLIILYILSAVMIIRVFNLILIVGVFRGGGDSKSALIIEAFTMWCIGVPLAFLGAFYFHLPVYWVYALVNIEEIIKFILGLIRFLSYKWIKNLVHNL